MARLTPIIDPTAAITGAPAQPDLLSIPVQHAQLLSAQQTLTQRVTQCEQVLTTLTAQRDVDHHVLAQQAEQLQATTHSAAALRQDVQGEIEALRDATQTELGQLRQVTAALTPLVQRVESALHDVADQLAHERTERARGHAELVAGLAAQSAATQHLEVVTQQMQTKQTQVELEQRTWQQQFADTRELLRDQQRLTTALSDELTAVRRERQEERQDWQRQLSALQECTAATHADLLAHLQTERQRRRVARGQATAHVDMPGGTVSESGA